MRLRLHSLRLGQNLILHTRIPNCQAPLQLHVASRRLITADEKPLPQTGGKGAGPNESQLPHVSEEAAATGKILGEGGPEIEEQGTPVQEVSSSKAIFRIHTHTPHTDSQPG